MKEFKPYYTEKQRQAKINREFNELWSIYRDDNNPANIQVRSVCTELAFVIVMLIELRYTIIRDGAVETYKNGANQYGQKKSVAVEVYDKTVGQFMKLHAQLNKLLPAVDQNSEATRELMEFIMHR